MRRIAFALALLSAAGWSAPSRAQWWGGGPGFGVCRPWTCPGAGWARPGRVVVLVPEGRPWAGPGRFWGGGGGWGPGWGWRREMRLRRIENWRRWVEAERDAERRPPRVEAPVSRFRGWARARRALPGAVTAALRAPLPALAPREELRPARVAAMRRLRAVRPVTAVAAPAESAVALLPPPAAHLARPTAHAAVPSRILAAAAMFRRPPALPPAPISPAALRVPEPPPRPARSAPASPSAGAATGRRDAPAAALRPVVLRNQPAPAAAAPAPAGAVPAVATPTAPAPSTAPAADVPVAPLD